MHTYIHSCIYLFKLFICSYFHIYIYTVYIHIGRAREREEKKRERKRERKRGGEGQEGGLQKGPVASTETIQTSALP